MKTYIRDLKFDEVIERIKKGEIIIDEETGDIIKYYNGMICKFYKDGTYAIGCCIQSDPIYSYYFETEKPLTFEEGKFYKTRGGKKAYISKITTTRFYGIITGKTALDTWNLEGTHWYDKSPHKNDLISKWKD